MSSVPGPYATKRQGARSYGAQQSDDRTGIEETWLGDKAEAASHLLI
jgi:hypothetical protein